jgi:signal peptidase I
MILRLFFGLSIYVLPIFPDYGFYIEGVLGIFVPYIIYVKVSKLVEDSEKRKPRSYKTSFWFINVPVIAILAFLVILVSGIFKYQIIAIGSGSMSPLIEKGDAVIISKIKHKDIESIKVGQILVFVHDGKYITHRVVYVSKIEDKYYFQTKGDANSDEDNYTVEEEDIIGVTSQRIKWIGLPTVWLQELMSKEK